MDLGEPQQRLVLAILIVHAGELVSTDRLVDGIWGDIPPGSARKIVQGYVSGLRRALGSNDLIESRAPGYRLSMEHCDVDANRFADLIAAADGEVAADPEDARVVLREALALWRGTPFEDLSDFDALRPEITRLELLRDAALQRRVEADIYAGYGSTVVAELADLTRRFPLQERLWGLRMLALHRSGRQAEALRVFAEARAVLANEVGLEPSAELRLIERRILDQDPVLDTTRAFSSDATLVETAGRNPYKGLRVFEEADAADFYGRDELIRRIHEAIDRRNVPRLIVVAGPSGSGKSSAVRAGLLPLLRRAGWQIATMFPGASPVDAFDAILEEPAGVGRSVIVVDQLEELFTLVHDETERDRFLDALSDVADARDGGWVVATIRADFLDRLLTHLRLARFLDTGLLLVTPLEDHEVRDVIVRPAARVGTSVEPALVAAAVRDLSNRAAALPLLEYTLTDLYDRAGGGLLTLEAYLAAGGITGSLVKRAEELFAGLDAAARRTMQLVSLRLVALTDEGEPLRQRVTTASLAGLEGVDDVLDLFGRHRLLSFDRNPAGEPTVEVAHEALLTQWPRLKAWIDAAQDDIRLRRRLTDATAEWNAHDRADGYLLSNVQLARFSDVSAAEMALAGDERALLERSRTVARSHRRRRAVIAWTAVTVFAFLAAVAFLQRQAAQREAREATAGRLAGESTVALREDPERSILLALEAVDISRRAGEQLLPETIAALQQAVQASRLEFRIGDGVENVAVSPDGTLLVTDSVDVETLLPTNEVVIWDATSGARLRTLAGDTPVSLGENRTEGGGGGQALAFSPDGGSLAVAHQTDGEADAAVILWDPATGELVRRLTTPGWVAWDPTWSADGLLLAAASWDGATDTVTVWEVPSGREVASFQPGFIGELALYDGSTLVVTHGPEERVGFYDFATGAQVDMLDTPGLGPVYLAVDQDNHRVALAGRHENLQVWDLGTRSLRWSRPISSSRTVVVSPDGEVVALAGDEGLIRLLDLDDGAESIVLAGHASGVWRTAFHPGGDRLFSVGADGETRVWDITSGGSPQLGAVEIASGRPFIVDFSANGIEVAVSTWDGTFERHAAEGGELLGSLDGLLTVAGVHPVVSHDWGSVAVVAADGTADVRDLESGERVQMLPPCTNPRALSPDGSLVVLDGRWLCLDSDAPPGSDLRSRVIEVASGEEVLDLGERLIFRADFSPGGMFAPGRYLAVNVETVSLEVYDMTSGSRVAELEVMPTMIRFDPTGRYLASGTLDGRVIVLDMAAIAEGASAEDALVMDRAVASGGVPGIAVTADGVVATSAFDSAFIRLWNIHTGDLITELRTDLDGSSPPQLNISPTGEYLLYPDAGQVLRKFFLDTDQLIDLAESRLTRDLTDEECRRYLDRPSCD